MAWHLSAKANKDFYNIAFYAATTLKDLQNVIQTKRFIKTY